MNTRSQENLAYDYAVWNTSKLPAGNGQKHSLEGHLARAEAPQNVPSGSEQWLDRYLTLGMAQLERVELYDKGERGVLRRHLPELRRHLTPYIGSVVVPRVASGEGTIAEITCLLNEVGGAHKRGESLIGWQALTTERAQGLKTSIRAALAAFATTWSRTTIDGRDAPALAEAVVWQGYSYYVPLDVRLPRAHRLLKILENTSWHQKVPGEVGQARREAMGVRSQGRRG